MSTHTGTSEFFVAGGTLKPQSPSYVERPADEELFYLALAGEFCYVLTPRQMGKSSLMISTARRLQAKGVRTATIDLTTMGTNAVDTWYLDLLTELADALELSVNAEAWWQTHASLGQVRRFTNFLRDVVLAEIKGQVVIFIDEIDTTLKLDFSDDFFAAIRATYNARASNPDFNLLTFVLLGVASPDALISDQARTPFNIGQGISLEEFSRVDAVVLQEGLEATHSDQGEAIFARIYHWTNGHPYLTQKLCLVIAEEGDEHWTDDRVDEMVGELFLSEEARKEANLKFVQRNILGHSQSDKLLKLYKIVLKKGEAGIDDDGQSPIHNQLKLSGIVKAENGRLRVRNEIYRRVFDLAWVKEHTAINWTRIVAIVTTCVALLATGFISFEVSVGIRLQGYIANFHEATNAPEERLSNLASVFRLWSFLGSRDYDYRARELFYGLSREEQLALFNDVDVHDIADSELVNVIGGLYVTLADVDGTGSTTPLLRAMGSVVDHLDETEETDSLRNEISSWLQGRELAGQGQYNDALVEYNEAIASNGDNPATRYERARVLIELEEYELALNDLDQVMAIAKKASSPTPTLPPPTDMLTTPSVALATTRAPATAFVSPLATGMPAPTPTPLPASISSGFETSVQMKNAVRELIYNHSGLVAFLASSADESYPNLRESGLVLMSTPTHTLISTPTSTPTPTTSPTPQTSAPVANTTTPTRLSTAIPSAPPQLLAPAVGGTFRNPISFEWSGLLSAGQAYQVTAYHVESGHVIQSGALTEQGWIADLPGDKYGEWRWLVSVVSDGSEVASSSEGMFWFQPFDSNPEPELTPTR